MTVRSGVNKPQASAVLDTNVALDWLVFRSPGVANLAAAIEANELRWSARRCAPNSGTC